MAVPRPRAVDAPSARIPFWRNVKTIGILAQLLFTLVVVVVALWLFRNVSTALEVSRLPSDFSFLRNRAGIPIAESPIPYTTADPYWKAILIGFLNTLKIALVGVVLASLLGVLVGVMRLSTNWLLRQLASGYVELIRNTPLAVQIIFWYTAALATIPPNSSNPLQLPFGVLLSNRGIAFPVLYPSYRFGAWAPWLVGALVLALATWSWQRQRILRSERPGLAWPWALACLVAVAGIGYAVSSRAPALPAAFATDFRADRGRGTVFRDANGNGLLDRNERPVPFAPAIVRVESAALRATTQNLIESRRVQPSTFRFPLVQPSEVEQAEVTFVDPADAERYRVHFSAFPSIGNVYQDRDGDGQFDRGEELDRDGTRGFSGVGLELLVSGFTRRVVADRDGIIRLPNFAPPVDAAAADGAAGAGAQAGFGVSPRGLFGAPGGGEPADVAEVQADITLQAAAPLVYSAPSVPASNYEGGFRFTTNYLAILLALVIYTASYIAEIVRAGVLAVSRGQTEAAKALGLSGTQTFNLVVFPQAIRIILPPMISQYLNLTKNSSLGTLAGYGELFAISSIVANQTGASVPMALMLIGSYLLISLAFAVILNTVNARMTIVGR